MRYDAAVNGGCAKESAADFFLLQQSNGVDEYGYTGR